MQMVLLTALGVGGATVIGALFGFAFKKISHAFQDIVLAFAAGVMLAAAVIGLIWFGLVSLFLPDSHEQIGTSSIITLNGTALFVLFFFGLLIVGVALIIRFLNQK